MNSGDLHSALKTEVVSSISEGNINYIHVRLQQGKDRFEDTIHAHPTSWSSAGIQTTDFLSYLGFQRSPCPFHQNECYCRTLPCNHDVPALAKSITGAFKKFELGANELEKCGKFIDRPEGWGFFCSKPSDGKYFTPFCPNGNGHIAPKQERMKVSEDEFFRYVFTWIEGAGERGWTTHYRAKHMPLPLEFQATLSFLGGFTWFDECPEFDFEGCWWHFTPYRIDESGLNQSADYAHRFFDAHANHFSAGLKQLLAAHADLESHGMSFLPTSLPNNDSVLSATEASINTSNKSTLSTSEIPDQFDVALSFAGSQRNHAEELAQIVSDAGFQVFYDRFYEEHLWGKDLPSFFDRIYRKASRFCVMFISKEYADKMWTNFERKSAQARAIKEKGQEYILPIQMDETDLDGLPPTTGYLSIKEKNIKQIAELLVKKLTA